jgi:hypothetical protein
LDFIEAVSEVRQSTADKVIENGLVIVQLDHVVKGLRRSELFMEFEYLSMNNLQDVR